MQRVRRAAGPALALVVVCCLSSGSLSTPFAGVPTVHAASVPWPPATLLLSEVQTGGASASDEFVEIANQGSGPVDLIGLEIVYATSSGSTVTRKATWSGSLVLTAGQRLLVVNGAGSYAALGDGTYSGGFAATGGALALRIVGGTVIDAVGWGDATNAFIEGTTAPAPPSGSSLERRPGGPGGNGTDTNDNSTDWLVAAQPSPQNLGAQPVPAPGPSPSPTASPLPTTTPSPMPTADPVPTATASPTPPLGTPSPTSEPTATAAPDPSPTPSATPSPSVTPTPTASSTPTPAPSPTPTPSPSPTPEPISIAAARALPDGMTATIAGVLTTDLGALESGRTAFLQDATAGIALYLDGVVIDPLAAGTTLVARGTIDERYAQRTLRVSETDLSVVGTGAAPSPILLTTGGAVEGFEGSRIGVIGTIDGSPESLADGTAVYADDGSGPVRVIVTPSALGGRSLASGSVVSAIGPLGQRDSSGTGTEGYRLYVTRAEDLSVQPPPIPTPSPSPTPTPEPTQTPTPTSSASPTPSQAPSQAPSPTPPPSSTVSPPPAAPSIAAIRTLPVGATVLARGVVTAEPGRLGTPPLFAIGDTSGGIAIKLPAEVGGLVRGRTVDVRGVLADPYGQLEIRPQAVTELALGDLAPLPGAVELPATGPDEASEGRLVRISGLVVVRATKSTSGDIGLTIETADGTRVRIMADASSRISPITFSLGGRYRITGIAGQRASTKGASDGYRIWVRDPDDVVLVAAPPPTPSPSPSSTKTPKAGSSAGVPATVSIATALRTADRDVAIEAIVTAPATLLDASGRRIVVQDSSGAVEILLPKDARAPSVATRIRAIGRIGSAYGAPRLRAESVESRGTARLPSPLRIHGAITSAHTWRLVEVGGRVEDLRKLGERWRAEVVVGAARIVVVGQPGAGIPSTVLAEGRSAEIVGIVRPAYPSATDRRPAVLPRSGADVHVSPASGTGSTGAAGGAGPDGEGSGGDAVGSAATEIAPDADLVDLEGFIGRTVRVGGLVVELRPTGFTLDDGTAVGLVVLAGEAADSLSLIEPDDAINVVGRVERQGDGTLAVVVDDPAAIGLGSGIAGLAMPGPSDVAASGLPSEASSEPRLAGLGPNAAWVRAAGIGVVGLLGISLATAIVTALRRRQLRRLMAARIAARLAPMTDPPAATRDPTPP